jgi:Cu2+-containing amine oxidase
MAVKKPKPQKADKDKAVRAKAVKTASPARSVRSKRAAVVAADPSLFEPLTAGESADALRILVEDRRLSMMAKVGRYRVIAAEPLVVKPPHWLAGHRLARVVIYDYAGDRCVDASVDLDAQVVAHLSVSRTQPMLSREEELLAVSVATSDERVREKLSLGEEAQATMQYWAKTSPQQAERRSAAVIFAQPGGHPSWIAVVDLLDNSVTSVVPASQW